VGPYTVNIIFIDTYVHLKIQYSLGKRVEELLLLKVAGKTLGSTNIGERNAPPELIFSEPILTITVRGRAVQVYILDIK